jgi:hypothetical protein
MREKGGEEEEVGRLGDIGRLGEREVAAQLS